MQLHRYYELVRHRYPDIGYFSLGIVAPCAFFLAIPNTVSHVPCISLFQVHAIFTPDALRTVNRLPPYLSRRNGRTPVLTSLI
jgi:hypothetical protein